MKLERLFLGSYVANCYVVWDEATMDALIIDPGAGANEILKWVNEQGLKVNLIVLTHRHPDHIGAVKELKDATGAQLAMHADEAPRPRGDRPVGEPSPFGGQSLPTPDRLLKEGDTVQVGSVRLSVIHTPGHTRGGICLLMDNILFSGDTLFENSVGRSDFPGGDGTLLIQGIMSKLMILPDETIVLPGHGSETTIAAERQNNPFLR